MRKTTQFSACLAAVLLPAALLAADFDALVAQTDRPEAPDLPAKLSWINTKEGRALTLADLKGKIVLLDFWTFG